MTALKVPALTFVNYLKYTVSKVTILLEYLQVMLVA